MEERTSFSIIRMSGNMTRLFSIIIVLNVMSGNVFRMIKRIIIVKSDNLFFRLTIYVLVLSFRTVSVFLKISLLC